MENKIEINDIGAHSLSFSTGILAKQANGSVVVTFGDTVVLGNVCMSKEPTSAQGFLPLMVDYQERAHSAGKFPGGYLKREGRPKEKEILTCRLIDRPLRPLFPKGLANEIQIIVMTLSSDAQYDTDVLAINAASGALMVSDIPFYNPIGAVRVAKIDGAFIVNPSFEERDKSNIDFVIVGTQDRIVMLEGEFKEVVESDAFDAITFARPYIDKIIAGQKALKEKVGKPTKDVPLVVIDEALLAKIKDKAYNKLQEAYGTFDKEKLNATIKELQAELVAELITDESEITEGDISFHLHEVEAECLRNNIIDNEKRPDGRKINEIRAIDCQVGILPRTHGSAVFTRGQTQALAITTLGSVSDEQSIETIRGDDSKHFMLHYNFPPFSVGEVKFMRGPSRRDIGHGMLAEKALSKVIPDRKDFPYTKKVVSEILESNGSSSMATVCATTLSLMNAGVPIKKPVAGIAMGLVTRGDEFKVLTDIAGSEDHHGDMDFKVAGTRDGITAIQLDTKIEGLTDEMIKTTLKDANTARNYILDIMVKTIDKPNEKLSRFAPKIKVFPIDAEKIGTVIGPGGKMIRHISTTFNVSVDISDSDSTVSVMAQTDEDLEKAINYIVGLVSEAEVGKIYEGPISRIEKFGAFVDFMPGKKGLIHISEVAEGFVKDINDVIKIGDIVKVKVFEIDSQGRVNLSIKRAQPKPNSEPEK